ncbi:MAG TPA: hypothetical protein VNU44_23590, partial [Bryobacteraceae bacterium]|nr:hypothetical protein [Bryobacteraceae bacterium]
KTSVRKRGLARIFAAFAKFRACTLLPRPESSRPFFIPVVAQPAGKETLMRAASTPSLPEHPHCNRAATAGSEGLSPEEEPIDPQLKTS